MKYLIANWKMSLSLSQSKELATAFIKTFSNKQSQNITVGVAPSIIAMQSITEIFNNTQIKTVSQNIHWADSGTFTGETSNIQLKELGCQISLVGHSERRIIFKEDNSIVSKRFVGALNSGILPVLCIGETAAERKSNKTFEVLTEQLSACASAMKENNIKETPFLIAYEPVWAISDGTNPTPATAEDVRITHAFIFEKTPEIFGYQSSALIYGGSANPNNAAELSALAHVDGFLVGGASLDAEKFGKVWDGLAI